MATLKIKSEKMTASEVNQFMKHAGAVKYIETPENKQLIADAVIDYLSKMQKAKREA